MLFHWYAKFQWIPRLPFNPFTLLRSDNVSWNGSVHTCKIWQQGGNIYIHVLNMWQTSEVMCRVYFSKLSINILQAVNFHVHTDICLKSMSNSIWDPKSPWFSNGKIYFVLSDMITLNNWKGFFTIYTNDFLRCPTFPSNQWKPEISLAYHRRKTLVF